MTIDVQALIEATREQLNRPQPQDHQRPPEGEWDLWVTAGGRNSGKSFGGMYWLADYAQHHPGLRARIIAPTFGDAVASCIEGPSGLKRFCPQGRWKPSEPGGAMFDFGNGSSAWVIGTPTPNDVDRLRALGNIHVDFFEEFAANRQAQAAWDQAELSRRNPTIPNKAVVATTPRPMKLLKKWQQTLGAAYVRVSSFANKYADPAWLDKLRQLEGTRLYRQEVLGEILDDIAGALWTLADIERSQVSYDAIDLVRYAIGVDPPSGSGTCGIVVLGADAQNHLYVVADRSITDASPNQWAQQVIDAYDEFGGMVVAEKNQGGKMVRNTLDNLRKSEGNPPLPIKDVWAAEGKRTRAEPISVLWEATEQVAHFPADDKAFAELALMVDQLTSWVPPGGENPPSDFSPDRLDALVWAGHHLRNTGYGDARVATPRGTLPGW